jgi:hypothetical protein
MENNGINIAKKHLSSQFKSVKVENWDRCGRIFNQEVYIIIYYMMTNKNGAKI